MEITFTKVLLGRGDFPRNAHEKRTMTNEVNLEAAGKNWQSVENLLPGLGEL